MLSKRPSLTSTNSSSGSLMQAKNSDVVKRGCLYVKRPPSSNPVKIRFKTWQKRFLVLRDMLTQDGDPLLELYDSESAANNSSMDESEGGANFDQHRCCINLRNVIFVDVYKESKSFPHAFTVLRKGKSPVIFGAKTDLEMREWMVAIKLMSDKLIRPSSSSSSSTPTHSGACGGGGTVTPSRNSAEAKFPTLHRRAENNRGTALRKGDVVHRSTPLLLQQQPQHESGAKIALRQSDSLQSRPSSESNSKYLVEVQTTDDSTSHQLTGEYHMTVTESQISLRRPISSGDDDRAAAIISWPLQYIRKLKSESKTDGFGDLITLVANSRCEQSKGTYTFRIKSGVDLIQKVRMFARKLDSSDSSCQRQQRDMAMLKNAVSSSLDKLLPSLQQDGGGGGGGGGGKGRGGGGDGDDGGVCQSMQSLVESSESSNGSRLDQCVGGEELCAASSSAAAAQSRNSYLPIIDDCSDVTSANRPPLSGSRSMTLSRSMGSIAILSINNRHVDSGFASSDEVLSLSANPPIPPPRPVHTIGLN